MENIYVSFSSWEYRVSETDRTIDGVAKTIAEVLEKKKYSID